jgi:hypothetical protein
MEPKNSLTLAVSDRLNDVDVGPSHIPLALLGEFQKDVAEFLRGASKDVDPAKVIVSIEPGSLALVATGLLAASGLWKDLDYLEHTHSIAQIDSKRAKVIMRWQAAARANPDRKYRLADSTGDTVLSVTADSDFHRSDDVWVHAEKYLFGLIVDMGGTANPNIHIKIDDGRTLTVWASQDQLSESEKNRMYREELLHVSAQENLLTGELRNMRLIAFQSYKPRFDEAEFDEMVARGTRAWSDVDDNWLESFRNGDA